MNQGGGALGHQVVAGLRAADEGLACAAGAPTWQCGDGEVETAIELLDRIEARLTACRAALLGEADQRAMRDRTGAPSTDRWLAERFRWSRSRARTRLTDSRELADQPAVAAALADGSVTADHATVITDGLGRIGRIDGVTAAERAAAARFLIAQADALGPRELDTVSRQLEETLTRLPSTDDPADEQALRRDQERAERDAQRRERNSFRFTRAPDGRCRATLDLGPVGEALTRQWARRAGRPAPGTDAFTDDREPAQRRADALVELLAAAAASSPDKHNTDNTSAPAADTLFTANDGESETHPAENSHQSAGHRCGPISPSALLTLTVTLEQLRAGLTGAGRLDTAAVVSAATLRTLACDALIVPAVMRGTSEVLDLGRARRLHTPAQRRAIILRDRACIAPGCNRPPRDCHLHHDPPWEHGGPTDTEHGYLLCGFHHHRVHQQGWTVRLAANGYPELIPPDTIDPQRRPRQHTRYQLLHRPLRR